MPSFRTLTIVCVLVAIQVALALTGLSFVPLPTGLNVTILAIPAVLAAVLAGPIAGAVVGGVFGVMSLALATSPLFQNPAVAIVPRVLIGPIAAFVYRTVRPVNEVLALALAGAAGAVANTGLVLGLAIVLPGPLDAPYLAPGAALDVARTNLPSEAVLAAVVTVAVGLARVVAARR
jgi:uncharacterized membrane protein